MLKKFINVQPSELKFPFSMQAQKEFPVGLPKDKFLVQSMIAPVGLSAEAITSDMFRKDKYNDVEELKLRVVFVTANPPSPIPEVSEEDFSPEANELENPDHKNHIMELFDADSNSTFEPEEQLSQDWDRVCQLIGERTFLIQENQELQYEVEMIRKQIFRRTSNGRNVVPLVLLACFLGFLV
uniref:MSP domain-containing protein n=1 Tax=Chenopodium quinoa TaxID=63459 RepID=A0A803LMK3_CHEQI